MSFDIDVSRETFTRLQTYHDLLTKWNPTINLVSKASVDVLWDRHIWDSAQIYQIAGHGDAWADIGSGGGLPGLVVAILALEMQPSRVVILVESDARKATFLRTVIRELGLSSKVVASRVEAIDPLNADILSARALADLNNLLGYAYRHLKADGHAIFLKGASWEKEVEDARRSWSFDVVAHKSKTNDDSAVLEVKDIKRA
ncbi:16S rRNA (guanine(527)-N(7))-methyltransferase RsmG [uncultured Roseobacter sp.]|uniref:16S rRNA (guanine(527)-N(7))-methyltransferase RsmG n=1 Tax=uncultured Roseobacter sp. TaxID=114847 RepID=UPI00262BD2A9|nr:16S rRNA (guanine(527)-N(7))-methyltransferase RsmG [uncultured Roseobacter sp.]